MKTPTFTATSGCDNFALEMHLVIEYKPDDSTNNGFLITKTSMNIIYGKWEPATTGELATI